jgi:DNA repair protein RadC
MTKSKTDLDSDFWRHPGGKLLKEGPQALSDEELLSIIIGSGIPGRSAEAIAEDIIQRYGSLSGLMGLPLEKLLDIRGLGDVRIIRIAAAFEIARRLIQKASLQHEETKQASKP